MTAKSGEEGARARLQKLRSQLTHALHAENFKDAASLRDEIQKIEDSAPEDVAVTLANEGFYSALRTGDAEQMALVWLQADNVSCAHALGGIVVGYDEVVASWRRLFVAGRPTAVNVDVISLEVRRNLAWVICEQNVTAVRGRLSVGGERVATNLFQKQNGRWRVVHHHASPVVIEGTEEGRNDPITE